MDQAASPAVSAMPAPPLVIRGEDSVIVILDILGSLVIRVSNCILWENV